VAKGRVDELWERAEDVIAVAEAAGRSVSRTQLARWHRAGLLERPVQHSLGLHGTEALYPPGTATIVLEICERKAKDRRISHIGWGLWWSGFPVEMALVRDFLAKVADGLVTTLGELVTEDGTLTDKAENALDASPEADLDSKTLGWVRRRAGTTNFDSVLDSLLRVAGGHPEDLRDDDLSQLAHAIGMDRARSDLLASTGKPWIEDDDLRGDFQNIAHLADPALLVEALKVMNDEELCRCRDEAALFVATISTLGGVLRDTAGRWAFGLASYGAFIDDMADTPHGQAWLTLLWSVFRSSGFDEGLDTILAQGPEVQRTRRSLEAIVALREAVPEVADAVSLEMLGKAISDPTVAQGIQAALAEVKAENAEAIDAFFATRPELRDRPTTSAS